MSPQAKTFLLSIDVEDWFQVENLQSAISRDSWRIQELRVEKNIDLILEILERHNTKATFFVLGWIAEKVPHLVQRIHGHGHEIASHGYGHGLVYDLTRVEFEQDVRKSKDILENIVGASVLGYRAPNFSITDWAIDVLIDSGYKYDSSLFPTAFHDRYGKLEKFRAQDSPFFEMKRGFFQVLLSCLRVCGKNIPWAGGGYFRIIPYSIFRQGIERIAEEKRFYCFYIHPWEFDPSQPKVRNIRTSYRFRHYKNIAKTEGKFSKLVTDFPFSRIKDIIP